MYQLYPQKVFISVDASTQYDASKLPWADESEISELQASQTQSRIKHLFGSQDSFAKHI